MKVAAEPLKPVVRTPARCCVVHAWVTKEIEALLDKEAQRRRIHRDQLVAGLVTILAGESLISAVMDR